jgi:hypothetical protein
LERNQLLVACNKADWTKLYLLVLMAIVTGTSGDDTNGFLHLYSGILNWDTDEYMQRDNIMEK